MASLADITYSPGSQRSLQSMHVLSPAQIGEICKMLYSEGYPCYKNGVDAQRTETASLTYDMRMQVLFDVLEAQLID